MEKKMGMKARLKYIVAVVAILSLLAVAGACGNMTGPDDEAGTLQFEGILLHEGSVLITESKAGQLSEGQLISLSFPDDMETLPPVGSLYRYVIDSTLRESWPPQGNAIEAEKIQAFAGHTVITFDAAEMILEHLPERAHLIDVRTVEEYKGGHIDGAQNIPIDEIEEAILIAIPEKSDVVIVYCRSGNRSAQAGKMLEDLGYKVILDAGGIIDYEKPLIEN
jgi:rhodanese-related sulfurtransferase